MIRDILKDAEDRMKKSLETSQHDMAVIRTGRATPSLLDSIRVDYYGSMVPLKQVANVAAPDARLLVVQVFDRNAIQSVEKAIRTSDLGLNPKVEGNILRLPIPSLTEDRRKELIKFIHKLAEEGRISIRNVRRDANEMTKDLEKSGDISEDDSHLGLEKIQELTDKYTKLVDEIVKRKEKEIMEE
ncbi:MAG: ribosome recycling factor [Candidatus Marinimicrobia bacterium CG08_land_8_20_14_0_20_45_22]|nr:MAG: ribosome recycling factor [Candidatus Marinimicrobia bacterium CG08_land_8_20_14_0_20_45_22]